MIVIGKTVFFSNGGNKMAARGALVKIGDGPTSEIILDAKGYTCAKFHAFMTKCPIFATSAWASRAVHNAWQAVSQARIRRLVASLRRRVLAVIRARGGPTRY